MKILAQLSIQLDIVKKSFHSNLKFIKAIFVLEFVF